MELKDIDKRVVEEARASIEYTGRGVFEVSLSTLMTPDFQMAVAFLLRDEILSRCEAEDYPMAGYIIASYLPGFKLEADASRIQIQMQAGKVLLEALHKGRCEILQVANGNQMWMGAIIAGVVGKMLNVPIRDFMYLEEAYKYIQERADKQKSRL